MIEREKRSMAAVETRELKSLEQALRRKITETETVSRSLMLHPRHEDESILRIHHDLIDLRRQRFKRTFNYAANPPKKRPTNDDWTFKLDPHPRERPKGY